MKLAKLLPNRCSNCGAQDFTLAVDTTAYSACTYDADTGQWSADDSEYTEPSSADEEVRFFCAACGEQHEVPKELA